ncbi:hypothetical protein LguiA_008653 [Lonicera macranthoides]
MGSEAPVHVFLVSFPAQGHVNPLLRLGKLLASKGLLVTLSTTESLGNQLRKANNITDEPTPVGLGLLRFEFFHDGLAEDDPLRLDLHSYLPQLELVGKEVLPQMVKKNEDEGRPVSCFINNPFIPWVCDVAYNLKIPSAMLWIQSCACFSVYYNYHHSIVPFPNETNPEIDVQLPFMPLLKYDEIPSFLHPTTPYLVLKRVILEQYKNLNKSFCVLMETFYELEHELINYVSKFCPIKPVGPLFKNPLIMSSTITGDMIKADNCDEWLDSKDPSSVVYISFGSVIHLKQEQVDEIAYGLLNSRTNFLWVMKQPQNGSKLERLFLPKGVLDNVGDKGKVVQWCSQEKVLAHPAVACFVTHCGWNSTMEALSSGVPVVAFPQWGDQVTNAKYLVDVFKVGVRLCRGEAEGRVVGREEVERSLREVIGGDKAAEMKKNALKWKKAAESAVAEGGSSDRNILEFVEDIKRRGGVLTLKSSGI